MKTFEWQDADNEFEEETQSTLTATSQSKEKICEENDKHAYQLRKYQDPSKDAQRQEILALTHSFGILLANNDTEKIAIDLLTDDFEAFVFSSTGGTPFQHYSRPQGFIDLWKGNGILERHVRSTEVDCSKNTAWQICEYKIVYEGDNDPAVEVGCEIFTLEDKRIMKYRACFGVPFPNMNEFEKFMIQTRKDKMFAKVKEINYALAGQPNFEKVASLFNQSTEYKIWRWGDHKCFTLTKADFSAGFANIEEEMCIKSIVPYDFSVDTQQKFISGHYVYHLEENSSGSSFTWLSTCIYAFDQDINLTRISQQGELYPEGETEIPFDLYTRDLLVKKAIEFSTTFDHEYNAFYKDIALYDCRFYAFMPQTFPNPGYYQGMKHIDKLELLMNNFKNMKLEVFDMIDVYVDHYNESHEVVLAFCYVEGRDLDTNKEEVAIGFSVFHFENGKVAKELDFMSALLSPIPSPFEDKTFKAKNIK